MITLIAAYYYIRLFLSSSFHYVISDRCRMIRREDKRPLFSSVAQHVYCFVHNTLLPNCFLMMMNDGDNYRRVP